MFNNLKNKLIIQKIIWVFLPPLIISYTLFSYFCVNFRQTTPIDNIGDSKIQEFVFDPLDLKNNIPILQSISFKYMLCLKNRNKIYDGKKLFDFGSASQDMKENIGAMAIHLSEDQNFSLYKKRNDSGCVNVDLEKLKISKVTSDVNTGAPIIFSKNDLKKIDKVDVVINPITVDIGNSKLFVRMQRQYFFIMLSFVYLSWFGVVLLFKNVYKFIID